MKKSIIWVFAFLICISSVYSSVVKNVDLKNIPNTEDFKYIVNPNSTVEIDFMHNTTRTAHSYKCQYVGGDTIDGGYVVSGGPVINTNNTFIGGNKIYVGHNTNWNVNCGYGSAKKLKTCFAAEQLTGGNTWMQYDVSPVCNGNYLGWIIDTSRTNYGSKNGNCGGANTGLKSPNSSQYYIYCIDASEGVAYHSNSSAISTITGTNDLTYNTYYFLQGDGTSSLGWQYFYDQEGEPENLSANRWQQKEILPSATSQVQIFVYTAPGSTGTTYELFASPTGASGTFVNVTTNGSTINLGSSTSTVFWGWTKGGNTNISRWELDIPQDTTPPSITYYNEVSGNCENWNTDKNNPCSTSSVVPTIQFNTSENAWCAIAGGSSNSLNINYTEMGNTRNCTGGASGEGGINHSCTLTPQDELVYDTSYLFISCKDSGNNMNRSGTSTSGPLKLSITGLETTGRNSIGLGIQNALLSGYTNYTDVQIYARNLSNYQVKGTFDRSAKKGSKMWAFNRIGVSDSYVNMFNLTPVLYTMEFANMTSTNLTNMTQALIEATR